MTNGFAQAVRLAVLLWTQAVLHSLGPTKLPTWSLQQVGSDLGHSSPNKAASLLGLLLALCRQSAM
jgi:hypothetical protein